jgi:ankyrin repeat protein
MSEELNKLITLCKKGNLDEIKKYNFSIESKNIIFSHICKNKFDSYSNDIQEIENKKLEIIKYLYEPEVNLETKLLSYTPLIYSCKNGFNKIVEFLIEKGASLKTSGGINPVCYPIHIAVDYNHNNVVKTILDNFGDINCLDSKGETPLFYAIKNMNRVMIRILVEYGAKTDIKNLQNQTIFDLLKPNSEDVNKIIENITKASNKLNDFDLNLIIPNNDVKLQNILILNDNSDKILNFILENKIQVLNGFDYFKNITKEILSHKQKIVQNNFTNIWSALIYNHNDDTLITDIDYLLNIYKYNSDDFLDYEKFDYLLTFEKDIYKLKKYIPYLSIKKIQEEISNFNENEILIIDLKNINEFKPTNYIFKSIIKDENNIKELPVYISSDDGNFLVKENDKIIKFNKDGIIIVENDKKHEELNVEVDEEIFFSFLKENKDYYLDVLKFLFKKAYENEDLEMMLKIKKTKYYDKNWLKNLY